MKLRPRFIITDSAASAFVLGFLFFLYLQINFWRCFGLFEALQLDIIRSVVSIICFIVAFKKGFEIHLPCKFIDYLLIIVGFGILMQVIHGYGIVGVTISAFVSILLSFVFVKKRINLFWLYAHILILTLVVGYKFYMGEDPNLMFVGTSRNTISVLFMIAATIINIEELKQKKKLTLWPGILFFVFSIAATGRGGVICALFYLSVASFYKFCLLDRKKKRYVITISMLSVCIICFVYYQQIIEYVENLEVFMRLSGAESSGDARSLMNMAYLDNMNFLNFFYGYDYSSNLLFIAKGHLNPHNSFISLHHFYGFGGLIFLGMLGVAMLKLWKKQMGIYVWFLIIILMRASAEQIMFPGEYDFLVLVFLLFSGIKETGSVSVQQRQINA